MSQLEAFDRTRDSIKALTVAVSMTFAGCASMTPNQAGRMAAPLCAAGGAYAGSKIGGSNDAVKAVGAVVVGYLGQDACRAAAEAFAESNGRCETKGVYKNGELVGTTSNCDKASPVPGNMPIPQ